MNRDRYLLLKMSFSIIDLIYLFYFTHRIIHHNALSHTQTRRSTIFIVHEIFNTKPISPKTSIYDFYHTTSGNASNVYQVVLPYIFVILYTYEVNAIQFYVNISKYRKSCTEIIKICILLKF